jgi:hypothetical protein
MHLICPTSLHPLQSTPHAAAVHCSTLLAWLIIFPLNPGLGMNCSQNVPLLPTNYTPAVIAPGLLTGMEMV